ncbi:hypothetical protein IEQ34_000488 [Dendrobium chrysotoxum]|uniref:Uncharacterized protein n=1 Tax=Dendrobium chrysotoxum TaxID=161865 RepID=A0AAV7HUA7_DENCH|nr:hypothetical protein IEQ34_000488 [Dendrobium chrysotoxum]
MRETNEIVIVNKPIMKEGLMPYYLLAKRLLLCLDNALVGSNFYGSCWKKFSVPAPGAMYLLEMVKERGVDVKLDLSLGLSSGEVECRK